MIAQAFGTLSCVIAVIGAVVYIRSILREDNNPPLISWFLWSLIGFALMVTYKDAGAKANIWPSVSGFVAPVITTGLLARRPGSWVRAYLLPRLRQGFRPSPAVQKAPLTKEQKTERLLNRICLALCLVSLGLWLVLRRNPDHNLVQWALYLAIAADICAAIPSFFLYLKHPGADRPGAWMIFVAAHFVSIGAITDHLVSNYALPIYMIIGGTSISLPLIIYRVRNKIPLRQWI